MVVKHVSSRTMIIKDLQRYTEIILDPGLYLSHWKPQTQTIFFCAQQKTSFNEIFDFIKIMIRALNCVERKKLKYHNTGLVVHMLELLCPILDVILL